jgi:hypothetical protein
MSRKSQLDEIYEHIPMRTSSLRHWSLTSTTPTTSDASSNPFARPQSSHTANTSVDLAKFSSVITSSRSSLDSRAGGLGSPYCPVIDSRLHSPLTSAGFHTNPGFNIDDYLSSDDDIDADSFVTPRGKQAEGEEELLFRDTGYGSTGIQLPGLFESIPEIPSTSPPRDSRQYLRHSYSSPSRFAKPLSLECAPGYGYDEEQSDDDDDEISTKADLAPGRRGTKRISALGSLYGRIEEESLEKVDVRTAIRLRKEAKARKRIRARRSKGKDVHIVDREEESFADVE